MERRLLPFALAFVVLFLWACGPPRTVVGSKDFTESYVLGEIAVLALEFRDVPATHRPGMGGTIILWQALSSGSIDTYADYTGTIAEQILDAPEGLSLDEIREALEPHGVGMLPPLGFDNTYALVTRRELAEDLGITRVSDLTDHPDLAVGLTHEFMERRDGWRPLAREYGLEMTDVRGIDHSLAYQAVARGDLDLMDAYSTDAKLEELDLVPLEDDLGFFPSYEAVFLYRLGMEERARQTLENLSGTLDEESMIHLNATAEAWGDYGTAGGRRGVGSGRPDRRVDPSPPPTRDDLPGPGHSGRDSPGHPWIEAGVVLPAPPGNGGGGLHDPILGPPGRAGGRPLPGDRHPYRHRGPLPVQPPPHRAEHGQRPRLHSPGDPGVGPGSRAGTPGPALANLPPHGVPHDPGGDQDQRRHQHRHGYPCGPHRSGGTRRAHPQWNQSE